MRNQNAEKIRKTHIYIYIYGIYGIFLPENRAKRANAVYEEPICEQRANSLSRLLPEDTRRHMLRRLVGNLQQDRWVAG